MAQAFLEHDEAAHAAVAVVEGVDLLEAHMEFQDLVALDLRTGLVVLDEPGQTGMDLTALDHGAVLVFGDRGAVLAGAHPLAVGIRGSGHQGLM